MTSKPDLLFLPLGGAGEIGMNLNLFGYDDEWLMVDLGVTFGDDSTPGVDVITPDPAFIAERKDKLKGLVLTHAHEDHVGAVAYLWPRLECPVYATSFTASVLRRKLGEAGLLKRVTIHDIGPGEPFDVGPFSIELVRLTHSIPEPNALLIKTPHGDIFHTGDWKLDPDPLIGEPVDEAALRKIGDDGVLALIGDSTNVFVDGRSGSEAAVRESLIDLVGKCKNRVVVATFASNVARLETLAKVAEATGRHAALAGRSLWNMYDAAKENGYLRDIRSFLSDSEAMMLPRDEVLLICTGSQGEPRAALARIASRSHPNVTLHEEDTVIFSSRIIPGNEKSIGRLHDRLFQQGIEIITEKDEFVHVSGHPARDELIDMYQWIRPAIAVPVHGEVRHLMQHRKLAQACQVPESLVATNGEMVRLAPGPVAIINEVQSGRLAVDGGGRLLPMDGVAVRERKRMMWDGAVVVTVVLTKDGQLASDPQVTLAGLADSEHDDDLFDLVLDSVEDAVDGLKNAEARDDVAVDRAVSAAVRRVIKSTLGKRPVTEVHVARID